MWNLSKKILVAMVLLVVTMTFVSALESSRIVNPQYIEPSFNQYYSTQLSGFAGSGSQYQVYWPALGQPENCEARQDFLIQIAPGGCSPAVVRSDLLAEQNVPVFCQLMAVKMNPLVQVSSIDSVSLQLNGASTGVAGVGFHPALAALRTSSTLLGSPLMNNIGYAVIVLKKTNEKNMTDWVIGNLTIHIRTNYEKAYGIGRQEFITPVLDQSSWDSRYKEYSFWNGKGYLRVNYVEGNKAGISIYSSSNTRVASLDVEKGKLSNKIYLPGFYCKAALQVQLNDVVVPETSVKLQVDENVVQLVKGGTFLSSCSVRDIRNYGSFGDVDIYCPREGSFTLKLSPADVELTINGNLGKYSVGSQVAGKYLVYAGELPKSVVSSTENQARFFIILGNKYDEGVRRDIGNYFAEYSKKKTNSITFEEFKKNLKSKDYEIVLLGGNSIDNQVSFTAFVKFDKTLQTETNSYYNLAKQTYESVVSRFPAEKESEVSQETYGQTSFNELEELEFKLQQTNSLAETYEKQISVYGDKDGSIQTKLDKIRTINSGNSGKVIYIDNLAHSIDLLSIDTPGLDEAGVIVTYYPENKVGSGSTLGATDISLQKNDYVRQETPEKRGYIRLIDFDSEQARFNYACYKDVTTNGIVTNVLESNSSATVKKGDTAFFCNERVYVQQINLNRYAKISLIPQAYNQDNYANFSFKIGIEQRAIKLSDEKTKEMISALDESIKKWEGIVTNLGNVVSGMKAACLTTSLGLTAKNLVTGFSGEATARKKVMETYRQKCTEEVALGKYDKSMDKCYSSYSPQIDQSIEIYKNVIKQDNTFISNIEKQPGVTNNVFFGENVVDTMKSGTAYYGELTGVSTPVTVKKDGVTQNVPINTLLSEMSQGKNLYAEGGISYDEMKQVVANSKILDSSAPPEMKVQAQKNLDTLMNSIQQKNKEVADARKLTSENGFVYSTYNDPNKKFNSEQIPPDSQTWGNVQKTITNRENYGANSNEKIIAKDEQRVGFTLVHGLGTVMNILQTPDGKQYVIEQSYLIQKVETNYKILSKLSGDQIPKINYQKFDQYSYKNKYLNPKVKYFGTSPYQGMPALVPFDLQNGWYAAAKQTLPIFGNSQSFDASGRVSTFWLCNVGQNGIEQFNEGMGDDICQQIDVSSNQVVSAFPGLTSDQAKLKVNQAIQAMQEAAQQSSTAKSGSRIRINGQEIPVGEPATNLPSTECQNFMSPGDCNLLFNVCDPVICPTSRCNLGGNYYASNVIQTGIIGGVMLCLPNFGNPAEGGVAIPLCLSGIHAGLDNYVQILKQEQSCLNESLVTGNYVGICDQLTAVYKCEFFWRQIAPFLNNLLPRVIQWAYGGGTRGGGEYANVANAWKNAQDSISYFTDYYGKNSMNAFQARSLEEAGTEVCKNFISLGAPSSMKTFIEPDSPVQFTAWFDEIPFTTATLPATSQYKVFFNIYAGKDSGDYYSVYMKRSAATAFYDTPVYYSVETGFLGKGQTASRSKDFTAPAGYNQVCVKVGYQEECGFKQVSTSFALNSLKDNYVAGQTTQTDVKTTDECVSGKRSLATVGSSLGEVASGVTSPGLENLGIVRICSTANPGTNVQPERWQKVGICDNSNVGCWLDKNSIKEAITSGNVGVLNQTMQQLQNSKLSESSVMLEQEAQTNLNSLAKQVGDVKKPSDISADNIGNMITKLSDVENNAELSYQKAKAVLLKARLYNRVTQKLFDKDVANEEAAASAAIKSPGTSGNQQSQDLSGFSGIYLNKDSKNVNWIYSDGKNTNLYVVKASSGNGYLIKKSVPRWFDSQVGVILQGKVQNLDKDTATQYPELNGKYFSELDASVKTQTTSASSETTAPSSTTPAPSNFEKSTTGTTGPVDESLPASITSIIKMRCTDGPNDVVYFKWNYDTNSAEIKAELQTTVSWANLNEWINKKDIDAGTRVIEGQTVKYYWEFLGAKSQTAVLDALGSGNYEVLKTRITDYVTRYPESFDQFEIVDAKDVKITLTKGFFGQANGVKAEYIQ